MKLVAVLFGCAAAVAGYLVTWQVQNSMARSEGFSGVTGAGAYQMAICAAIVLGLVAYKVSLATFRVLGLWAEPVDPDQGGE